MVSAPMHLQSNTSVIDVPPPFFLPFHDLDPVDPCGDVGRVADNAGSTFIPMTMSPKVFPRIGQNGQRDGRLAGGFGGDLLHSLLETIIADMGFALESFTINTHHIPACVIVDHRLPCLAIFGASQEKSAIRPKVIVHFHHDLEVFKACISDENAPVPRQVLGTDDGTVNDDPFSPTFVLTDPAMTRLRADMPPLEGGAIENRLEGWLFSGGDDPIASQESGEKKNL